MLDSLLIDTAHAAREGHEMSNEIRETFYRFSQREELRARVAELWFAGYTVRAAMRTPVSKMVLVVATPA